MTRWRLPLYLLFSLALWPLYTVLVLPPIEQLVHSDSAVPYLTTIEPWLPQDFFFWSAERFGSLAAVPWKVAGRWLFGPSMQPFYIVHMLYFFGGTALWLAAIDAPVSGLCFVLLMLPIMPDRVDEFLYPGHLYGALYAWMGAAVYLLLRRTTLGRQNGMVLAVCVAAAYWQHALVGVFMLGFVGLKYACLLAEPPQQGRRRPVRLLAPFVLTLAPLVVAIEIARSWAIAWGEPYYFHLENWTQFSFNLRDFAGRGLGFQLGPWFGLPLLAAVICAVPLSLRLLRRGRGPLFLRLFIPAVFGLTLAVIIGFNAHPRYTVSGRHERYFAFLIPLVFVALSQLPYVATKRRSRAFGPTVLILLTAIALYREFAVRKASVLDPAYTGQRRAEYIGLLQQTNTLLAAGCHGLVGPYWTTYVLAALTDGAIAASPSDYPRNPVLLTRILSSDNFCVDVSAVQTTAVRQQIKRSSCSPVGPSLLKCRAFIGPPRPLVEAAPRHS